MIINTHYYGSVEYTEEELVTFPEGLFGFSDLKQYLPLGLDDGDGSLLLLQSIENPDIAFFLINPPAILPDYCQMCIRDRSGINVPTPLKKSSRKLPNLSKSPISARSTISRILF